MGTDIIKLKQPGPYQTTTYFTIPVCSSCLDYLPPGVPPSLTQREPNVKQDPRLKSTNLHQISTPRIYLWQYLAPFFLVMTIPRHTMSRHNLPPLSPRLRKDREQNENDSFCEVVSGLEGFLSLKPCEKHLDFVADSVFSFSQLPPPSLVISFSQISLCVCSCASQRGGCGKITIRRWMA